MHAMRFGMGRVQPLRRQPCVRAPQRASTQKREALPPVESSEPPEFLGHRLQTSMTRAIVEDSTAGLGRTSRDGGSSGWWVILP